MPTTKNITIQPDSSPKIRFNSKKFNLWTVISNIKVLHKELSENAEKLLPYFWLINSDITLDKLKSFFFAFSWVIDIKRKKWIYNISKCTLYDEYYIVFVNGEFAGISGLYEINHLHKTAKLWCFTTDKFKEDDIKNSIFKELHSLALNNPRMMMDTLSIATHVNNSEIKTFLKKEHYFQISQIIPFIPKKKYNWNQI